MDLECSLTVIRRLDDAVFGITVPLLLLLKAVFLSLSC